MRCPDCGEDVVELTEREQDEILLMVLAHFPRMRAVLEGADGESIAETLTCLDCEDAARGQCSGQGLVGFQVFGCMEGKVLGSFVDGQKLN